MHVRRQFDVTIAVYQSSTEWGSKDAEDLISVLQEELVNIRLREAESQAVMKELKTKLYDAEEVMSVGMRRIIMM